MFEMKSIHPSQSLPQLTRQFLLFLLFIFQIDEITSNTLKQLYLFKEIGVNSIVFTESDEVVDYLKPLNITTLPVRSFNMYGLPILRDLVIDAREHSKSEFIVFINADILINPDIFFFISHMKEKFGDRVVFVFLSSVLSIIFGRFQLLSIAFNCFQSLTITHNHSQSLTITHNH